MYSFVRIFNRRKVKVSFLTPRMVRIQIIPDLLEFKESPLNRYQFIREPDENTEVRLTETNEGVKLQSPVLEIGISPEGLISASDSSRGNLFSMCGLEFAEQKAAPVFEAQDGEDWIGFGDLSRDRIFHRGHKACCWVCNVTSYIPVPFFMSTLGYGILVNTTCLVDFDMCSSDPKRFGWDDERGVLDFYIFAAPTFKELISLYTDLTGKPKLPPEWSFGLWYLCRDSANDAEAVNDALNFRREEIPCDLIGLEPGWMEKDYDKSTDKKWHPQRFPLRPWQTSESDIFIKALKQMGFHLELWLCQDYDLSWEEERRINNGKNPEPQNGKTIYNQKCNEEMDPHFANPQYMDEITKKDEPWFEHLKKFVDWGADFFKQDGAWQVLTHPDRRFANGMTDHEMHNLYPLFYSRQMWEGFAHYTNRRPVVFTVAGWTGFQAWSGTWTGDTGGRIDTLGAMLNTSSLGHSWVTNDMAATEIEGVHFGYLQPWSQINSWSYFRMPWVQHKNVLKAHKYYSRLRSRLIPYIYSWGYFATHTAQPLLLPLHIEFQNDIHCRTVMNEYLLGRDLLVTIYRKDTYLPSGQWKDFWSGKIYSGEQHLQIEWPQDRGGGLFIREGALIPFGPVMQYRKELPLDKMELYVFPSEQATEFELYEDDGITFEYLQGKFNLTKLTQKKEKDGSVIITIGNTPAGQTRTWNITAALDHKPKTAENNGRKIPPEQLVWDEVRGEFRIASVEPGTIKIIR